MTNEDKQVLTQQKNPKKKILLKVWLISVFLFILSIVWLMMEVSGNQSGDTLNIITLTILLSLVIGGLSFLWWLFLSVNKIIKIILVSMLILTGIIFLTPIFVARYAIVTGQKMEPAYKNDEYYLVSVISYKLIDPKRSDVVEYRSNSGGSIMGRIIGLPNENLILKKGEVIVNGDLLNEPYVDWSGWEDDKIIDIKLEENKYLIMFDKREKDVNQIDRKNIVGKFIFKLK